MYLNEDEFYMGGNWPSGPYHVRLERTIGPRLSASESWMYGAVLRVVGTNTVVIQWCSDHPSARWVWKSWEDDFNKIPEAVGREFIALVGVDEFCGERRNVVKAVIAEVVRGNNEKGGVIMGWRV